MGTWGTGPFDTDDAGDMVANLTKSIHRVVDTKSDASASYYYGEARCAVQFVIAAHGTDILGGPSAEPALRALVRMRKDTEWLSGWKSPTKIAHRLDNEILEVISVMNRCKGCGRSLGKKGLRAMYTLADDAIATKVPRRPKQLASKRRRTTRGRVTRKK